MTIAQAAWLKNHLVRILGATSGRAALRYRPDATLRWHGSRRRVFCGPRSHRGAQAGFSPARFIRQTPAKGACSSCRQRPHRRSPPSGQRQCQVRRLRCAGNSWRPAAAARRVNRRRLRVWYQGWRRWNAALPLTGPVRRGRFAGFAEAVATAGLPARMPAAASSSGPDSTICPAARAASA